MSSKCLVKTKSGKMCRNKKSSGLDTCWVHADVCSICIAPIKKTDEIVGSCKHRFHEGCIHPWREKSCRCPMCREVIFKPRVVTVRMDKKLFEHPVICDFFTTKVNKGELLGDIFRVEEYTEDFHVIDEYSSKVVYLIKKETHCVQNAVPAC